MAEINNNETSTENKEEEVKKENITATKPAEEKFDWDSFEQEIDSDDLENIKEFDSLIQDSFSNLSNQNIIEGVVVDITDKDVIVDISSKSEGVIPLNEFRYNPDLKIGDTVEVFIKEQEDKNGRLVLSHKKAKVIRSWNKINECYDTGEVISGLIKCRTRGGMIVEIFGVESFLPGSQIDIKPIRDYEQYINKTMDFKVIKINPEYRNVVISHKALIEADIEEQKKEIVKGLEKGQVLEGIVKNITPYGVFVDLGGIDGLIHITDLSWNRISHPSEVVELEERIKVVILNFEDDKTKIQLGLKQLKKHPWDNIGDDIQEGKVVKGKVTVISDYGAFVEIQESIEGLIHVSEMSWSTHLRSAQDFVKAGDEVEAIVLNIDKEQQKLSLGMKQLIPDPWTDITTKYPVNSKHKGIVRNFAPFGVFIELEAGIDGLVYISDLSWTQKIKHPSEFLNIGDTIEVVVLELDLENRKLSLGHKQTTENPWKKYKEKFAEGTVHEGTVIEVLDRGSNVSLNENIVAFVPKRHMEKSDGSKLKKGEKAEFKILESNIDFKRVVVSHTNVFKEEELSNIKKTTKPASKDATFGDIESLAKLRDDKSKK